MKIEVPLRRSPVVPIVPLIDILAILLIFFIATTTFKKKEARVSVKLPQSSQMKESGVELDRLTLSVTANGEVFLGEASVPLEQLGSRLTALKRSQPDLKLEMKADQGVDLGTLVEVWDEASSAEIRITEVPLRILLER